jgi:hypothetical protein
VDDVIGIRSGTATIFTANMSWSANRDVSLYIWEGSAATPPPTLVTAVSITSTNSLAISWAAVPGQQYWIDVTNGAPPGFTPNNIGAYTLVVTSN